MSVRTRSEVFSNRKLVYAKQRLSVQVMEQAVIGERALVFAYVDARREVDRFLQEEGYRPDEPMMVCIRVEVMAVPND